MNSQEMQEIENAIREITGQLADGDPSIEEIAQRLEDAQIKGSVHSFRNCPLAVFTRQGLEQRGLTALSVAMEYVSGGVAAHASTPDGDSTGTVGLPAVLAQFALAFDQKQFPALLVS